MPEYIEGQLTVGAFLSSTVIEEHWGDIAGYFSPGEIVIPLEDIAPPKECKTCGACRRDGRRCAYCRRDL